MPVLPLSRLLASLATAATLALAGCASALPPAAAPLPQPVSVPATPLGHASDEEVPFITTPDKVTVAMLQLAAVGRTDTLIDLGSGDGRIVITAARRFGARGLGVDIVPDLVASSQANAQRAGVADRALFRVQDLFDTDLAGASVVTLYLLPEVNLRLRPRLLALAPGTRIVSHDWDMADWPPDRTLTLDVPDKAIGREKLSRLHLWVVPARLQGLWCGPAGATLRIDQRFQRVTATLVDGRNPQAGDQPAGDQRMAVGHIDGVQLRLLAAGDGAHAWLATAEPDGALKVQLAPPGAALKAGQRLQRSSAATCPAGSAVP